MPNKKNIQSLQEIKEKLDRAKAVFFAEYQGIPHKTLEEARRLLSDAQAEISISKNTLMNLAFKEKQIDAEDKLQGALASFFAYGDPLVVVKQIFAFFKKNSDVSKIKFGLFEGKLVDEKTVALLSTIPSKEVLFSQLVGMLQSPLRGLVYGLNWNVSKLVRTLKAVEEKRQRGEVL